MSWGCSNQLVFTTSKLKYSLIFLIQALLTLNSCPMFTYNERDLHRMPQPARTHLPIKQFIADSNVLDEDSARDTDVCLFLNVSTIVYPDSRLKG